MKKITYVCALTVLSFSLIGCTSTSTTDKTSPATQEHTQNSIQLNSTNIIDIEILRTSNNDISKSQTDNEEMIKPIVSAVQNGTSKTITLDQKKKQSAHSTITVTYKDDSKEEFLVWIDNKKQITIAKDEKKGKVEAVTLNIKHSKMMKDFFKNDKT
ncbi:lipoprotein [Bacillus thuringiensis MC28]|nr:lipoprotein [Bacillus thuringiensis MC28]